MKKNYLLALALGLVLQLNSQVTLYETFAAPFNPTTSGWDVQNLSSPSGTNTSGWRQGNAAQYLTAITGAPDDYFAVDKYSTSSAGATNTISCWLITPTLNLTNGAILQFAIKSFTSNPARPERLQVYYSFGAGTNVGNSVGTATNSSGTFTNIIADINPNLSANFANLWSSFGTTYSLTGIATPTVGRIAFRYYVPNGGAGGPNANYIGLDEVRYQMPCPRPSFFGDITGTSTVCVGASTSLKIYGNGVNAPTTYTWFNGATTSLTAYTPTVSGLNEIWSLGQNASGCQYLDISFVNVNPSPTLVTTFNPGASICAGKSFTLTSSGASTYTYALSTSQGFTANPIVVIANSVSAVSVSQFTISGKAANGCVASQVQSLTINPNPTVSIAISSGVSCINKTITVTASGADTYSWSGAATSTMGTVSYSTGGTAGVKQFTVYGISLAGCESASAVQSLTVSLCTGINELSGNNSLSVYPNPFNNELHFYGFSGTLSVYNNLGETVIAMKVEDLKTLDTSALPSGLYILNTKNNSGVIRNLRLIKN